jgi:hypothetical protein
MLTGLSTVFHAGGIQSGLSASVLSRPNDFAGLVHSFLNVENNLF